MRLTILSVKRDSGADMLEQVKTAACDAGIPYGYQFMSKKLHFHSNFLLVVQEKQKKWLT